MLKFSQTRRWLVAVCFVVTSCTQADKGALTGPTASGAEPADRAPDVGGAVGGSAEGDIRTGPGALEIDAVRVDRLTANPGLSILAFYADPGRTYRIEVGETIEFWVEWDRDIGKVDAGILPNDPRLIVNWGDGTGTEFTGCGSCKLFHKYLRPGLFPVTVTLDDRVDTRVERAFFLDATESSPALACGAPASTGVDESDFDDYTTATLGPVNPANRLSFTCDASQGESVGGEVRASGEFNPCDPEFYGHSHGDPVDLFVEVHDPNTNAWTQVFTTNLTNDAEFVFGGTTFAFPSQPVDQVRLRSVPGQGQTYHDWGGATATVFCQ